MGSEWITRALKDCAAWHSGGTPRKGTAEYWGGDIPWISAKSLKDFFVSDSEDKVTEEGAQNGTKLVPKDAVLFVVRGMSLKSEFRIGITTCPVTFNQDLKALVANDEYLPHFLAYAIRGKTAEIIDLVGESGHGTGVLPTDRIQAVQIPFISLKEQQRIVEVLKTLDDKIELNRRMNATLEGMAQALFKSWFVDFDPVIDNALTAGNPIPDELADRAEVRRQALSDQKAGTTQQGSVDDSTLLNRNSLFPASFQETEELGWIPKGWEISKAENVVTRHKVKQKFTKKNASAEGSVPIFDQGAGLLLGYSNEPADQDSSKENPKFIFGDHTCITHLSTKPFSVGPNVIPLSAKTYAPYWTFYAIKDLQEFQEYRRHWMEFSIKQVLLPSLKLAEVFDGQIRELRASMESNDEISKTLTKLRDTLLPKLISGELRIPDAEQLTDKALA